jgi:hypothetical protein
MHIIQQIKSIRLLRMNSAAKFEVKVCYYGARESLVTHITNVLELSSHLQTTPYKVKDYIATRCATWTALEGDTLKVKGLLKTALIDLLMEEIRQDS